MAQLVNITKVEVGPRTLTATVRFSANAPRMTSDDLEGTTRVYNLMPGIIEHVCLGDAGETFRDVMGHTELAHLLEHMTVELLTQSNVAGDISSGRTRATGNDGRTFEIELACPDDVLVAGALSSATWMMEWAFEGGSGSVPDVAATVDGLVGLVDSLPEPEPVVLPMPSEVASRGASVAGVADATQVSGPMLRLVDDDPADATATDRIDDDAAATGKLSDAAETGRLEGGASSVALVGDDAAMALVGSEAEVQLAAEAPPRESPEARQAATDMPRAMGVQMRTGLGAAPASAPPSVTDSLPASRSVR